MSHGRVQVAEGELREPKKKKVKPGTLLRDPYPIIFWNKLGIPPCKELWPAYMGDFDGDSVIIEDPGDMHEIFTMGYFGKRLMCRRGYEQSIGDIPVVRERQWKRKVEWAAECGYILMPPDKGSFCHSPHNKAELDSPQEIVLDGEGATKPEHEALSENCRGDAESRVTSSACVEGDLGTPCGGEGKELGADKERGVCGEGSARGESATERQGEASGSVALEGDEKGHLGGSSCSENNVGSERGAEVRESGEEGGGKLSGDGARSEEKAGEDTMATKTKGETAPGRPPRVGGGTMDASKDEGEPPPVAGAEEVARAKGDGESSCVVEMECSGVESHGEEDVKGGDTRECQGMRRLDAEVNGSECGGRVEGDGGSAGAGQAASASREKSFAEEGAGDPCSVGGVESGEGGSGGESQAGKGERPCGGEEEAVDPSSKVVDEGEKASKSGGGEGAVMGESSEEVVLDESEGEGRTGRRGAKGEGGRTTKRNAGKGKGSKRSRTPSSAAQVEKGSGKGSGEGGGEDQVAASKKLKVSDASEEKEQEVTIQSASEGCSGATGGDVTIPEGEPKMAKETIEDGGGGSTASCKEEKEAGKLSSCEGLAEGKREERRSVTRGSNECEIVEIEDESSTQNSVFPETAQASTSHKNSEGPQQPGAPCGTAADSDDDIMEVSIEEEEVREVAQGGQKLIGRRRSNGNYVMGEGAPNAMSSESERIKFQNMLRQIRRTLPRDIEVTEVNLKHVGEGEKVDAKCSVPASTNDEDDDVIEINLQKSDMVGLEGCFEEEEDGVDGQDERATSLRRRVGSGFRRRGEAGGLGDAPRTKQEAEAESVTTGNLGSDCEVDPCIVIPDSDSEVEETQGSPRLESDPSIFLPSLDVLQLIPEEAFFLAYGLGCLVVWDERGTNLEPDNCDSHEGGGGDAVPQNDVVKRENSDSEKEAMNGPPSSAGQGDGGAVCGVSSENGSLKAVNEGCDNECQPTGSPHRGTLASTTGIEEDVGKGSAVSPSIVGSVAERDSSNKSSVDKAECSDSQEASIPAESPVCRKQSVDSELTNTDKEPSAHAEKVGEEVAGVLDVASEVDPVPVTNDEDSKGLEKRDGERMDHFSAGNKNEIEDSSKPPKENGNLDDPSITVIDLADSPPSRQWARKGWSGQDEEDVVTMDTDGSLIDPEQSMDRTLRREYQKPMSILEMWNAFRSCRASVPSSIPFETTYAVYHHFRSKRWVVKPGIRFGGDFLLYKDGPPFYHASYLVVIDSFGPDGESKFDWKKISGMNRLTENIAKDLMLCRVEWPPSMTEKDFQSPECLMGLVVQEILVRRWVSLKERDAEDQLEEEDDEHSFIPLKL